MQIKPDAEKLKRWREERAWSQEHLADAAGISLRTVQRVERGEPASRETLLALAAAFDVDVTALTIDPEKEAQRLLKAERARAPDGLRLALLINLGAYAFGMIVFAAISMTDGPGGYTMKIPALWWTVGVTGLLLAFFIVEVVRRFERRRLTDAD